ncbi:MAG: ATP-grasp domain-containing protein [Acidobacteria bacterium]|nr:MAG: ATP-grasp domain-containing protein [Acidobacteriota bacterium]
MAAPGEDGGGERFDRVLIANRGEIARRIVRTLHRMGLGSVAVYAGGDRDAPHVAEADVAVRLGAAPEAYLDPQAVIAAARAAGAGAIHPGYGFLAENAAFAERCAAAGLVFVGPPPEALRRLGDKVAAKALAAELGVPVIDGFATAGLEPPAIGRRAEELGYPLLVKAAAGGGGTGMRRVAAAAELDGALAAAAREAESAFGDGALLIERLLDAPRHVEVQILADAGGRVLHLFERDCSLQRRHQKIVEECPSPAVDAPLRRRLGAAAVALARAVGYAGAGTVEFLLQGDGSFFFLEMNPRLQVEHPVTEAVTGLDLVRLQIEIAQGLPLPFDQDDLELDGHAIEARLYAEDPARDFLPAGGTLALWAEPELPGLRVDAGVERGAEIGPHYDPLLAKVIAWGRHREEARRRLRRGLAQLAAGGIATNRDLLLALIDHDAFRRGDVDVAFLERHPPAELLAAEDDADWAAHAVAAALYLCHRRRQRPGPLPAGIPPGWRNNPWRPQEQIFEHRAGRLVVRYRASAADRFSCEVTATQPGGEGAGEARTIAARLLAADAGGELIAELDGVRRRFRLGLAGRRLAVHGDGRVCELMRVPRFPSRRAPALAGGCAAPMTGKVTAVLVAPGDRVAAGTPLVAIEAMKMEHQLASPIDGVVDAVRVAAGQMVDPDEVLVVVTPEPETTGEPGAGQRSPGAG